MNNIKQIQDILTEDVNNKLRYYIELIWDNNMGSIHIYSKKELLSQTIVDMPINYTNYWKKEYKTKQII